MEPSRKYRIVAAGRLVEEESRDSTYIHNLEQLVMEQTIVISDLKKDVAQINSSIEEIKKMLGGPKLGNLDRNIYSCFPIANKNDMEKSNELLANPESRENITAYIRNLKPPGDTDFNCPFQNIFADDFISNYNSKGTHGKEDFTKTEMYKVLQDAWMNEYVGIKEFQTCIVKTLHNARNRHMKRLINSNLNSTF